jgi:hypothetical protein
LPSLARRTHELTLPNIAGFVGANTLTPPTRRIWGTISIIPVRTWSQAAACFTASAYGTVGNLGRNVLVGPGYVETDLGVMKGTRITERLGIQFRGELFNLFNHPNFNFPTTAVFSAGSVFTNYQATPNPTAGQITSLVGSGGLSNVARQTQFSLKLIF